MYVSSRTFAHRRDGREWIEPQNQVFPLPKPFDLFAYARHTHVHIFKRNIVTLIYSKLWELFAKTMRLVVITRFDEVSQLVAQRDLMYRHVEKDNIAKCASAVVRNTIQWERNFTIFSGERKRFTQFIWASLERIHVLARSLIFVEQRVSSFTGSNELYFSCVRSQWQSRPDRARSPLAVRRKQKSKLGRSEYTRIPRLSMEFNICCLRYGTRGRAFFALFPTRPPLPLLSLLSLFILRSRFSIRLVERHDLCLKYAIENRTSFGKKHQELN